MSSTQALVSAPTKATTIAAGHQYNPPPPSAAREIQPPRQGRCAETEQAANHDRASRRPVTLGVDGLPAHPTLQLDGHPERRPGDQQQLGAHHATRLVGDQHRGGGDQDHGEPDHRLAGAIHQQVRADDVRAG